MIHWQQSFFEPGFDNNKQSLLRGVLYVFSVYTDTGSALYIFLCGICNQWYSIQFYRLGWNGSENEFYRVEEL